MGYDTRFARGGVGHADLWAGIPAHSVHPIAYTATTPVSAINDCYFFRVPAGYTRAATTIKVYIGVSSGNVAVAVYNDNGSGLPGARVATSGSVASPGTGPQSISLGATVEVRVGMWLAVAADNTTVTFGRAASPGANSSAMGTSLLAYQATAFPPPASASASAAWRSGWILVAE